MALIAANGIRLVIEEHRTTTTPTLKSGKPGVTKVSYGEVEDAVCVAVAVHRGREAPRASSTAARSSSSPLRPTRTTSCFPPASDAARRLPRSHKETARKAFERLTKKALPATHVALARALEREARRYASACDCARGSAGAASRPSHRRRTPPSPSGARAH